MPDAFDNRLDRYAAGELSPAEQRELAQSALDDPALFDTLTATALLRESARTVDPAPGSPVVPRRRRPVALLAIVGGSIAAAAAIGIVMIRRPSTPSTTRSPSQPDVSDTRIAAPRSLQPLESQPVFLTARVDPDRSPSEFRTVAGRARLPRDDGTVSAVEGGDIEIDLGSIDGLMKGSTLRLLRQDAPDPPATLTVETVFRERARGRVPAGTSARQGDRVEVSRSDAVRALLEHAHARAASGDLAAARPLAELAVRRAEAAGAPPGLKRLPLAELGALEHRAGAIDDAERHLRRAVEGIDADPAATGAERAQVLTALGAVLIDKRAYNEAEPLLRSAQPYAIGRVAVRIANDLGALAAIRGDTSAAETLYRSALEMAGNSPDFDFEADRQMIEANLQAVRRVR